MGLCYPFLGGMFTLIYRAVLSFFRSRALRRGALGLVAIFLLVFLASSSGPEDRIGDIVGDRGYNLLSWELSNFFDKWVHKATSIFGGDGGSDERSLARVEEYFRLNQEIDLLDGDISRSISRGVGDVGPLLERRQGLDTKRRRLRNEVEEIIEGQISKALAREGLSWKLPFLDSDGYLFPPVDFRFDDSPALLALSPRDQIDLISTRLLEPDISLDSRVEIELGIEEGDNISALVTGTGGVATYPSVIPNSISIRRTLRTVAHEWVHHYMIFHPLGLNYWADAAMISVNETIANVIGDQIGDAVFQAYYAGRMDDPDQEQDTVSGEGDFDFNRVMRETRLRVDELLAEGKVEEAERFMEERRLFIAENGIFLRRLNQAFFAFNGTYADRPDSVSPIGGQVKEVRAGSRSVKDFIGTVSRVSSYQEFLALLEE